MFHLVYLSLNFLKPLW